MLCRLMKNGKMMSLPEESRGFLLHSYLKNQITKVGDLQVTLKLYFCHLLNFCESVS